MKKVTNKELIQKIGDLENRVEELEQVSDVQTSHVSLIREIIEIFKEMPFGRALINRAYNRLKLRYLKQIVLPRRQVEIEKLKADKTIPEDIKNMLMSNATQLFNGAEKDVQHRLFFEKQSANKVRSILGKLQKMFTHRTHPRVQIPNHIRGGESHASNN